MGCAPSRRGRRRSSAGDGRNGQQPGGTAAARLAMANGELLAPASGQQRMSLLLIFALNDGLGEDFAAAADDLEVSHSSADSSEKALEAYIGEQHDVVLLDARGGADFNAETLIQSLRAITHAALTTFVAVTGCDDTVSFDHLLELGFDRRFRANGGSSQAACREELLTVQRNSFRLQQQLEASAAAFAALDCCGEAVEITDEALRVQYVNAAHERAFGFSASELLGRSSFEAMRLDSSAAEEIGALTQQLRKGKVWDGAMPGRRRSGASVDLLQHHFHPVRGRRGKVQHFVCLRQLPGSERPPSCARDSSVSKDAGSLSASLGRFRGRESAISRGTSLTMEAPIQKVVALLGQAQEEGGPAVAAVLDKALSILQQPGDLYTGGELAAAAEDSMTSGYVGGLMTGSSRPPDKKRLSLFQSRRGQKRPSDAMLEHISQLLENSTSIQSLNEIPERLIGFLDGDDEWSFDILELERVADSKPLVYLAMKTLRRFNVCQFLQCSEDTLLRWLQVMQDHYHADNCYHNATHAADVMQSSAYFLERDRVKAIFDETDEVASLLGAIVHDLDHPGRTNPFLINSQHKLAVLYNDISVLESHHVSLAFQLTTRDKRINIFSNLGRDDYKSLRQAMVDIVLATEMAKHFEHVGKFQAQVLAPLLAKESPQEESSGGGVGEASGEEELLELLAKPENRAVIRRLLIKCSDVSNPCRSLKLCKEWARRIADEYFQQTDDEKARGLPIVMPVFDRSTCNFPRSQTSFIDFFLRGMFDAWHSFCHVPELVQNLSNNYAYWQQLAEEQRLAEEAMKETASES